MVFITIVTGAYKPTYILGASHCIYEGLPGLLSRKVWGYKGWSQRTKRHPCSAEKKNYNYKTPDGETHDSHANFTGAWTNSQKSHTHRHTFWEILGAPSWKKNKTKFNPRPKLPSKKPLELLILHKLLVEFRWMTGSSFSPMLGCPNRGAWKPSNKIV